MLKKIVIEKILAKYPKLDENELNLLLEKPKNIDADLALPCFKLKKILNKEPNKIAQELGEVLKKEELIEKISVIGPYLNIYFNKIKIAKAVIEKILGEEIFKINLGNGKRVMVEYSQPNTNKPLHVGHVRNNCIGFSFSQLLKILNFDVIKVNLINDRGIHICKSMAAYLKFGKGKTPQSENIKGDHFVGNYYVLYHQKLKEFPELEKEAQELLRKYEEKDKEVLELWKKMNSWVLEGFNETYRNYRISFDEVIYESEIYEEGKRLVLEYLQKGIFKKREDNAIIAELEQYGLPDKIVLRADGTSLYITQDIYLAKYKFEKFNLDESIYVVGSEQNLYFKQLFKILELMGFPWAKNCHHLSYGMVYLPEGKMKSREGKVVDADDLLQNMENLAIKEIEKRYSLSEKEKKKRARDIALAAINFYMLKTDAKKDIFFDMEKAISFEGESGPYLQYSYARAKSILKKAEGKNIEAEIKEIPQIDNAEWKLILLMQEFPNIIVESYKHYSLHILCRYLINLAAEFNSFYHKLPVLKEKSAKLKIFRLKLVDAFTKILERGLKILNIAALEEM